MQQLQSYRVQVQRIPPTDLHQVAITEVFGLKARNMGDAIACAQAVSALPVVCVYRQDRGAR